MTSSVNSTCLTPIAETLRNGLQISEFADMVCTTEEAVEIVRGDATVLAALLEESWSSDAAWNLLQLHKSLLTYGENLLCANIALNEFDVVTASLTNGTSVTVSYIRDRLEYLYDYRHPINNVTVQFPAEFSTPRGDDCPRSLTLRNHVKMRITKAEEGSLQWC